MHYVCWYGSDIAHIECWGLTFDNALHTSTAQLSVGDLALWPNRLQQLALQHIQLRWLMRRSMSVGKTASAMAMAGSPCLGLVDHTCICVDTIASMNNNLPEVVRLAGLQVACRAGMLQ